MNETLIQVRQASRKNNVFNLIREKDEQLSRFDICKITKYSTTTVKIIVDSLIEEGLVFEGESKDARVGRRPSILSVNRTSIYFAGIECSSAAINFTVINAGLETVHHEMFALSDPVTEDILSAMDHVLEEYSAKEQAIWAKIPILSFSLPGKINTEHGTGIRYGNVPDWKDVDFKKRFERYGKKMSFAHNVDSMLSGYRIQNNLPLEKSIMFIVIRNSVGVRLFGGGTLLSQYGILSEIAHVRANGSSRRCSCGKKGCYDTEISERAIKNKFMEACSAGLMNRHLTEPGHAGLTIPSFVDLAASGEPVAYDIFLETISYLAEMIEVMLSLFRPDMIVLSSFLCTRPHLFGELLEKELMKQRGINELPAIEYILPANELGSFGAAVTGYEDCFTVNLPEI